MMPRTHFGVSDRRLRKLLRSLPAFAILSSCGADQSEAGAIRTASSVQPSNTSAAATQTQSPADDGWIRLKPGDDVATIVQKAPAGAKFILTAGLYRNVTITPHDGQTFVGENGAVLSGAIPISGWRNEKGLWVADGYPAPQYSYGEGRDGLAQFREDLFVDGKPYLRVADYSQLGPGSFLYDNGSVWISDNPSGRETLAADTEAAFKGGTSTGVTISNLTIRYYASMAQHGAIEAQTTRDWTIDKIVSEKNHSAGLAAGSGMKITGSNFQENGQLGIHAQDVSGLTVTDSRFSGNNYAGFDPTWDAGGIKILTSTNVAIFSSCIFGNFGAGIWMDWDNKGFSISDNTVIDNSLIGVQSEASRSGEISHNTVAYNNVAKRKDGYWGAEILIQNSSGIDVHENKVLSSFGSGIGMIYDERGEGRYGKQNTINNSVKKNIVIMQSAGLNGFAASADKANQYNGSNVFDFNSYYATSPEYLQYTWNDSWFTQAYISKFPIEKSGSFIFLSNPASMLDPSFRDGCK